MYTCIGEQKTAGTRLAKQYRNAHSQTSCSPVIFLDRNPRFGNGTVITLNWKNTSNMAVLHLPVRAVQPNKGVLEEWRELESDPGLFTLLIEDYGVQGVRVEEIYDVSKKIEGRVYGFVFLFRWGEDRRARNMRKKFLTAEDSYVMDSEVVNQMFFAHQIVNNSCATHALLSVLLNCTDIGLGHTLGKLKDFSAGLDPESKGLAIANMPELARAHNKYSKPSHTVIPPPGGRRASVISSAHALLPETYHFVSYVPIGTRLFELDGLKEFPIDHGPWGEQEEWTDLFRRIITQRLANAQDILFNLMAVVKDPIPEISEKLRILQAEQRELLELATQLAREKAEMENNSQELEDEKQSSSNCEDAVNSVPKGREEPEILGEVARLLPTDPQRLEEVASREILDTLVGIDDKLQIAVARVIINDKELESWKKKEIEEFETKQRYHVEASRRTHDYDPLITEFIKMLAINGQLPARLMRRPSNGKSVTGHKRKPHRSKAELQKKAKTTLLVNGSKVG